MADEAPDLSGEERAMAFLDKYATEHPEATPAEEPAYVPTEDPPVVAAEEAEEAPAEAVEAPAAPTVPAAPEQLQRAYEAVRRATGLKAEGLKALGDPTILEIGLKLADAQDFTNTQVAENRELNRKLKEREQQAAAGSEVKVESSPHPAGPTLDAVAQKLAPILGLNEGEARAVAEELAKLYPQPKTDDSGLRAAMQAQAGMTLRMAARIARDDLLGDYPGLKEAKSFQAVLTQMDRLNAEAYASSDPVEQVREMMRDSASIVFRSQVAEEAARKATERGHAKGTASSPGRRAGQTPKPPSPEQRAEALMNELAIKHKLPK